MATKTTADKNFYENFADSQKKVIENITESASKVTNNPVVKETLEKGSDLYKNWLDNQLSFLNEQTEKLKDTKATLSPEEVAATAKNWMETQMKMTREFMDFSMNTLKSYMESTFKATPYFNGPVADDMKKMYNDSMNLFNQWNDTLTNSYEDMLKNFKPGSVKDTMAGMLNMTASYNKFSELWMPFMKSLQDKSFNADMFKNMVNPTAYKEMFEKMFNFNNVNPFANWTSMMNMNNFNSTDWMKNFTNMMNPSANPFNGMMGNWMGGWNANTNPMNDMMSNWMKSFNVNTNPYQEWMKSSWNNFSQNNWMNQFQMPASPEFFGNMMNNYNSMYANTQQMFAPMFRMMPANANKQNLDAFNSLVNKMMQYNIKFGEMQYLTYTTGSKAMQKVAERMQEKVSKGEEFKGMNSLYTEWLSISDKVFVELFETDEYSKIQAEVASLQHSIKKEAELMMEKMFVNIPVITRSEMDGNYKTIHDLKKRVSELEKTLEDSASPKAPVKKTSK